ncbi:MAG: 50S ribosomal protein L16 [Candidatus Pacearchaeota archaeon]
MVALRKASAYSKKYARPYTRVSKKKSKNFIKTAVDKKIAKYNMGDNKSYNTGKYQTAIRIISKERIQIRDNALEAVRQSVSRQLESKIPKQYYFEVRVHPHHIMRENKMLTGAGADRMSSGMKHSYGKPSGRAALVKENQEIFVIYTNGDKNIKIAKEFLNSTKSKIPCATQIVVEKVVNK